MGHYEIHKENWLLVEGFIESHGGERFNIDDVAKYTELTYSICQRIINAHPLVSKLHERGSRAGYLSGAPPLEPLTEPNNGLRQVADKLGEQARADYYLMKARTKRKNSKRKVWMKF